MTYQCLHTLAHLTLNKQQNTRENVLKTINNLLVLIKNVKNDRKNWLQPKIIACHSCTLPTWPRSTDGRHRFKPYIYHTYITCVSMHVSMYCHFLLFPVCCRWPAAYDHSCLMWLYTVVLGGTKNFYHNKYGATVLRYSVLLRYWSFS